MRKNKNIGARVIVRELLVEVSPKVKFRSLKKVSGVIVERGNHEQYYHTSDGGYANVRKHLIESDCWKTFAIKLDNNVTDIEGNNVVVVREFDLTFLDRIKPEKKIITEKQYLNAKRIVKEYENQNI